MSDKKELLEKRRSIKKHKPRFVRKDIHKKKKIKLSWRRPKGLHNKQRLKKKGHVKTLRTGYGSPAQVRNLHKSGLKPVVVSYMKELSKVTKEEGVIVSSKVGDKKRKQLIEAIKKQGLTILNLDADKSLAMIDSKLKQRKEERKNKLEKKTEKKKGIEEKIKKEQAKTKEEQITKAKKASEPTKAEPLSAKDGPLSTAPKAQKPEEKHKQKEELSEEEKKKLEKQEKDKLLTKKT